MTLSLVTQSAPVPIQHHHLQQHQQQHQQQNQQQHQQQQHPHPLSQSMHLPEGMTLPATGGHTSIPHHSRRSAGLAAFSLLALLLSPRPATAEEEKTGLEQQISAAVINQMSPTGDSSSGSPATPLPSLESFPPSASSSRPLGPDGSGATAFSYPFVSEIPSDLKVRQYYRLLQANRPPAWQQVALQLRNGEYLRLSQGLSHEPFSNVRAAALYLPWALLQNNEFAAASECRKAYNGFDDHVRDLEQVADAAANKGADAVRVQQSFLLMSASMDNLLTTLPRQYILGY
ncbi:MAG: hypothetical protein WDW36_000203 [Sanguina aurantia]